MEVVFFCAIISYFNILSQSFLIFYQLMQVKVQVQNQILIWILMSKDLMQTGMACHKMIYYPLIAYMFITNELIFKNFSLSDCRKAKCCSRMLFVVLQ